MAWYKDDMRLRVAAAPYFRKRRLSASTTMRGHSFSSAIHSEISFPCIYTYHTQMPAVGVVVCGIKID